MIVRDAPAHRITLVCEGEQPGSCRDTSPCSVSVDMRSDTRSMALCAIAGMGWVHKGSVDLCPGCAKRRRFLDVDGFRARAATEGAIENDANSR